MWNSIVKPAVVLFVVCLVISGSLAFINGMTKDIIEENTRLEQEGFRKQVLTAADRFLQIEPEGTRKRLTVFMRAFAETNRLVSSWKSQRRGMARCQYDCWHQF